MLCVAGGVNINEGFLKIKSYKQTFKSKILKLIFLFYTLPGQGHLECFYTLPEIKPNLDQITFFDITNKLCCCYIIGKSNTEKKSTPHLDPSMDNRILDLGFQHCNGSSTESSNVVIAIVLIQFDTKSSLDETQPRLFK